MRGLTSGRRVAVLAAALLLPGCATMGGYDLAPNGLPRDDAAIRRGLAADPEATHQAVVEGRRELPNDDLLRLLYAAMTGRSAGRFIESSQYLDVASYLAEDRVTTSVSRQAVSFITSDRALAYTPGRTERLMIAYVAALNFLEADDLGGAVVEARRIEALLDRLDGDTPRDERSGDDRFFHYLAGTIFAAAGEWNSADVAFRRTGVAGEPPVPEPFAGVPADSMAEVVVVVERGFVPHRVEQSVAIVVPPFQARKLTDGDAAEKAAAAAAAAARILLFASHRFGDRGALYTGRRYPRTLRMAPWRDECGGYGEPACHDDDGEPYLLRVSWPVLYRDDPVPDRPVAVRVDGTQLGSNWRLDVGDGVRRDFADDRAAILARTVFRAATKMALSATAEEVVSRKDETAGKIAGLLVNLGTLLTERADTRSWHLLPGVVDLVRVPVPAGTHRITIDGEGWLSRAVDLGVVDVQPGETVFLTHRAWR